MTKEEFVERNFRGKTKALLSKINKVLDDYQDKGHRLTLRQLYYQLVSTDTIQNTEQEYHKLSRILADARMAGVVDWDVIEDRTRTPKIPPHFESIGQLVASAADSYRLDRWKDQKYYVEVWLEKDALSGILEPITRRYHVHLLVNRGYPSVSAMYDSAKRIKVQTHINKKPSRILYLGDHDPSGENMVQDIEKRLREFGAFAVGVQKIALTMEQIEHYNLPPNPAKRSDPRYDKYVRIHGNRSWELDALRPEVLTALVQSHIKKLVNHRKFNAVIRQEEREKMRLVRLSKRL